ncbi:U3 small nucleolar RNA-associated protein 6 [Galdieria sulphuraria]|nr:U3 small nucleolar RNA-associated protein 6 [Galdieria sulphuraria]
MAQVVERLLETTVEQLRIFQKLKVITEHEAKQISRKRRSLERNLLQRETTPKHYFRYLQYEHNVQLLLKRRVKKLDRKDVTSIDKTRLRRALFQQDSRVMFLFNRASRKFPMDWTVWKNYLKYCLQTNSSRLASRVLGRALARLPNLEELWLIAISFEFDHRKNMRAARVIAQRALRQLENSQLLWKEYFRIELYYLCRQLFQRQYLGLPIPEREKVENSQSFTELNHRDTVCSQEVSDDHIPLQDSDMEEDNEDNQLLLDEELDLVYRDISQHSSISHDSTKGSDQNQTISISVSFWEGCTVLLILKHILQKWETDDHFLASLVQLVMETPFSPQVLKNEIRSLIFSKLRTYENCRLALVKGWFQSDSNSLSSFQCNELLDQLKEIVRDIPTRDVLNRCCEVMDSLSMKEELKQSFLNWVSKLDRSLIEDSHTLIKTIQSESLDSLITTWQHIKDEKERKDMECFIIDRLEQEVFDSKDANVDNKKALLSIQFLNGEMGTLASLNNLECLERIRKLYDRILHLCPMNVSVIRIAIHVEERQNHDKQSIHRLRKLFDAWCEVEGSVCIDCWLQYITFERKCSGPHRVTQLYWKAMKMLQNKAEFMERFSLLQHQLQG